MDKAVIAEKFSLIDAFWSPRIIGEINGQYVKLAKGQGELVWHTHDNEDEFFLVFHGELSIHLRDKVVTLGPGECFVVPKGTEHKTSASEEAHFMMVEPKTTQHTGQVQSDQTVPVDEQEWI